MADEWQVVPVSGSWGTEYYIQDQSGRTMPNLDGSEVFRTTDKHLAEICCEQKNKENDAPKSTKA